MSRARVVAGRIARQVGLRSDPLTAPVRQFPPIAEAYRGLTDGALLFDRIRLSGVGKDVVLLLPSISPEMLTAGPMTVLKFSVELGDRMGLPLRIITTNSWHGASRPRDAEAELRVRLGKPRLRIDHVGAGAETVASPSDIWVCSLWKTALAADIAARLGLLDRGKVIYLIQDYEPAFFPWSTQWAAAQSTYRAGFHLVVNTTTLADHLRSAEQVTINDDLIMTPALDLPALQRVAVDRRPGPLRLFCYARPANARNMYALAVAAAARAVEESERPFCLVLAGENNIATPRINGLKVENLGQVDHAGYYKLMTECLVALSLMMSPHPSHPPLDWAVSGGWAVTNAFGNARDGLHPRLLTAPADPDALGQLLVQTLATAQAQPWANLTRPLGRTMCDVVGSLLDQPGLHC